jgi:hypothetical protein
MPSGRPTYNPILLLEEDGEMGDEEPDPLCDDCVEWTADVGVKLAADVVMIVKDCADVGAAALWGNAVETMLLTCAMVYTTGSAALKARFVSLQHVVLRVWEPSKPPVGQHHLLSDKQ